MIIEPILALKLGLHSFVILKTIVTFLSSGSSLTEIEY